MDFNLSLIVVYVATYLLVAFYSFVILTRLSIDIGRELEIRYFRFMVVSLILYCIFESLWAVGNFGYSQAINRLNMPLTVANSILVNAFCYFWFCYVEAYLDSSIVDRPTARLAALVPFALAIVLSVSSLWTGLVFYLEPDGTAGRGPLYLLLIVCAYGYAAVATLRMVVAAIRARGTLRRECLTMAAFAIPPAVVGLIDTAVPMMPIVAPAFFLSFFLVFTMLQESQISHDALTGLNNRRRAVRYFEEAVERASESNPFIYYVVDGDFFKDVNDRFGHIEGDRALCVIARGLCDACQDVHGCVARWGGDEFVVMTQESEVGSASRLAGRIHECLEKACQEEDAPCKLSVSVGYAATTDPSCSLNQIMEQADAMLYREKQKVHGAG